jgi:hypothetical protein
MATWWSFGSITEPSIDAMHATSCCLSRTEEKAYDQRMTDAQADAGVPRSWPVWLFACGLIVAFFGALGALFAKRAADAVALVTSQPTLEPTLSASSATKANIALKFPAHFIGPDYTWVWVAVGVVLLGLIAAAIGGFMTRRDRRSAA